MTIDIDTGAAQRAPAVVADDFDPMTGAVQRDKEAHCGGLATLWRRFNEGIAERTRLRNLEDRARAQGRLRR